MTGRRDRIALRDRLMAGTLGTLLLVAGAFWSPASAFGQAGGGSSDPRVGLPAGWLDAGEAASNLELVSHRDRPPGFFDPQSPGSFAYPNTDIAFRDDYAFVGNYNGFNVYNISDPENPELQVSVVCPGGQADLSVYGNLLFMSVEEPRSRIDCGPPPPEEESRSPIDPERFEGVRIFDVSDIDTPKQVAAVQTCRGSHTHTLVRDPDDSENVYIYVSGTGRGRPGEEVAGCDPGRSPDDAETAYWRITVIRVPLAAPEDAEIVSEPRIFADPSTGSIAGLWSGGDHGVGTQRTSATTSCHDITAYPEIGLAAGACQGNGMVLDISDPVNPVRIADVSDPNFAYWHSATFNNDGSKVIFTDEWGGGTAPRCLATDSRDWGADAVFDVVGGRLRFGSYYKLPAPQTEMENCVAHNGSLVPVPGRDIEVQAWYQGGVSVFDFTDPEHPYEIAYFDRGPISDEGLVLGGYWSAYWYNGHIYASEIARGFDVFDLEPSEYLSQNELDAAKLVQLRQFNAQAQTRAVWPSSFVVARAYLNQISRDEELSPARIADISAALARAEGMGDGSEKRAALSELGTQLWGDAGSARASAGDRREGPVQALAEVVLDLAAEQR